MSWRQWRLRGNGLAREAAAVTVGDLDVRPEGSGAVRLVGKGGKTRHCPLWPATMTSLRAIDTTNIYAEVDLETKAQMLAACGSFGSSPAPTRRWRDDPSLMQFLRSL